MSINNCIVKSLNLKEENVKLKKILQKKEKLMGKEV